MSQASFGNKGFRLNLSEVGSLINDVFYRARLLVIQREETALRRTPRGLSTAAQLMRGSLLTFSGLKRKLQRWKMKKQRKSFKLNSNERMVRN